MQQVGQLQEAKNKFSQVVENALQNGVQVVRKHGVEVAVVLSYAEYRKLVRPQKKLSEFFRESPLVGVDFDLSRDPSAVRADIEL